MFTHYLLQFLFNWIYWFIVIIFGTFEGILVKLETEKGVINYVDPK